MRLLFFILLFPAFVFGQYDSTKKRAEMTGYGYQFKNIKVPGNGSFVGPTDTLRLAFADSGAIAAKNGTLYAFNGRFWTASGGFDTTGIRYRPTAGDGISITGAYPAQTIAGNPDTLIAGSGITLTPSGTKKVTIGANTANLDSLFGGKLDSVRLRGSTLREFAAGDSTLIGTVSGGGGGTLQEDFDAAPGAVPQINAGENYFEISADYDGTNKLMIGGGEGATLSTQNTSTFTTSNIRANLDGNFELSSTQGGSTHFITGSPGSVTIFASTDTTNTRIGIGTQSPTVGLDVGVDAKFRKNGTPGTGKVPTGTDANGNWTWETPSGGSGVTTMAAIGSSPNANGASISGSTLTLQPASGSFGGVLTAGSQDIGGVKNFTSNSTWGNSITIGSANSNDYAFDNSRTITGNSNRHGYGDESNINIGRGFAYASYDNKITLDSNKYFDHHCGYQNRPIMTANDSLNTLWGFRDQPTYATGGIINYRIGYHVQTAVNPVITPQVSYAFRVDAIGAAKTDSNFAFHASGGRMMLTSVPVVTANYGLISLGAGTAFNGSTTGFFAGAANGTYYAANAASGFVGDLMSLQTAGVTRMAVGGGGNVMIGGPVSLSNSRLTIYNSATSTAVQTQYVNGSTGTGSTNGAVVGLNSSNNLEVNMRQAASIELKTNNTTRMTISSGGQTTLNGNFILGTAGNKLSITTGSNASVGTGTFTTGAATISTTAVTANSLIFIQYTSCSNCGTSYISARSAGTSFTVTSTNGSDASTFNYWIIN